MEKVQLVGQASNVSSIVSAADNEDLFATYLAYIGKSEAPMIFHRWSFLAILSAWMGRRYFLPFGHSEINCNMYVMLMGEAGSRKTTAINQATKLLKAAGFSNISASKTTKEKFLLDLSGVTETLDSETILEANLFGGEELKEDRECFISAEEFNIFVGNGNIEFLALLGTLWDFKGEFENKIKNAKSDYIWNPTISMLAGNTATSFSLAFPPEAIGQGIFSRLLLIHGERTGIKITFPEPMNMELHTMLLTKLLRIRETVSGPANLSTEARALLDKIYQNDEEGISDVRFASYNNRRFTHLIKLCLLVSAMQERTTITGRDVITANTILTYAELMMPKALGEFGKSRQSDINHKIITLINSSLTPKYTFSEIWKHVHNDLDSPDRLRELLSNLVLAEKLVSVKLAHGKPVWVCKGMIGSRNNEEVDWTILTEEERRHIL